MNSKQKSVNLDAKVLLVAEAGVDYKATSPDPFQAWIELMEVVEELCQQWPKQPITKITIGYRL